MVLFRIGLLLLAIPAASLAGQSSEQIVLSVQVRDDTGAFIPAATIQLSSKERELLYATRASDHGEAVVTLDPGTYTMLVESQGFKVWSQSIAIEPGRPRTLQVRLEVGDGGGVEVVPDVQLEIERFVPDEAIAEVPLEPVALPSRPLRRHQRRL